MYPRQHAKCWCSGFFFYNLNVCFYFILHFGILLSAELTHVGVMQVAGSENNLD
jgi:hypothetical protein